MSSHNERRVAAVIQKASGMAYGLFSAYRKLSDAKLLPRFITLPEFLRIHPEVREHFDEYEAKSDRIFYMRYTCLGGRGSTHSDFIILNVDTIAPTLVGVSENRAAFGLSRFIEHELYHACGLPHGAELRAIDETNARLLWKTVGVQIDETKLKEQLDEVYAGGMFGNGGMHSLGDCPLTSVRRVVVFG